MSTAEITEAQDSVPDADVRCALGYTALTVQVVRSDETRSTLPEESIRVLQTWVDLAVPLSECALVIQAVGVGCLSVHDLPWLQAFAELGGRVVISECAIEEAAFLHQAGLRLFAPSPRSPRAGASVVSAGNVISVRGALVHPGDYLPLPAIAD